MLTDDEDAATAAVAAAAPTGRAKRAALLSDSLEDTPKPAPLPLLLLLVLVEGRTPMASLLGCRRGAAVASSSSESTRGRWLWLCSAEMREEGAGAGAAIAPLLPGAPAEVDATPSMDESASAASLALPPFLAFISSSSALRLAAYEPGGW